MILGDAAVFTIVCFAGLLLLATNGNQTAPVYSTFCGM